MGNPELPKISGACSPVEEGVVADTRPRDFCDYAFLGSAQEAEAFLNAQVPATVAFGCRQDAMFPPVLLS